MRKAVSALVVVTLLGGCGSREGHTVARSQLSGLVLKSSDLPHVFVLFDDGAQISVDNVAGPRFDRRRFGREGGWKARYHRPGTTRTLGPLVIESRADVFKSTDGARKDLEAYKRQFEESVRNGGGARLIPGPAVGDESRAMTQIAPGSAVRSYAIAWRDSNVTASVSANGFEGHFNEGQVLELVRSQQRRIAKAASKSG